MLKRYTIAPLGDGAELALERWEGRPVEVATCVDCKCPWFAHAAGRGCIAAGCNCRAGRGAPLVVEAPAEWLPAELGGVDR